MRTSEDATGGNPYPDLPSATECDAFHSEIATRFLIFLPSVSYYYWNTPLARGGWWLYTTRTTPAGRTFVTEPHVGYSGNAPVVALDASHAHGFVAAGVEKCWSRFDHCGADMHDVFIVVSEDGDGEHIARTIYAASEDDARQTHQETSPTSPSWRPTKKHPGSSHSAAATSHRTVRGRRTRWTPTPASSATPVTASCLPPAPIVVGYYRHEEDEEDEQHG